VIINVTFVFVVCAVGAERLDVTEHSLISSNALKALESGEFQKASELASKCITKSATIAERLEEELRRANTPILNPRRIVAKVKEGDRWEWTPSALDVLRREPLNDVAASYIVLGDARAALAKARGSKRLLKEAKAAYEKATSLRHAYVYDGRQQPGVFWRPATIAYDRLNAIAKLKP
jgi:hypothetical protein